MWFNRLLSSGERSSGRGVRLAAFPHSGAAIGGLTLSYAVAAQDPVPSWELDATEWINDVPDGVATLLYPVMQFGTLGGPILVAAAVGAFQSDWWLSGATIVAGVVTWFATKGIKRLVDAGARAPTCPRSPSAKETEPDSATSRATVPSQRVPP